MAMALRSNNFRRPGIPTRHIRVNHAQFMESLFRRVHFRMEPCALQSTWSARGTTLLIAGRDRDHGGAEVYTARN